MNSGGLRGCQLSTNTDAGGKRTITGVLFTTEAQRTQRFKEFVLYGVRL